MPPTIERTETVYKGWLTLMKAHLRDGEATYTREVEHHGDGACVLPYDPERRVALMIRLPRTPLLVHGESALLIEAPAGLIEKGEEPGECVRREAFEEAGVQLSALESIGHIWTMPGISTERMHMFLAPYRAADRTGPGGGLAEEHEGITVEEMPLAELARRADQGSLTDIRTLVMLLTLRVRHPALFVDDDAGPAR